MQAIARRHDDWIAAGWQGGIPDANARTGLDEMYVADPRFAANYDKYGANTPEFVRDAMHACAEARQLS